MHGDTLCTDDLDYQAWRRTARSAAWQREFLGNLTVRADGYPRYEGWYAGVGGVFRVEA